MKQILSYTIEEHPNPDKVYQWIREHWYDLNDSSRDELIESLEAFAKEVGGRLIYSICTVPDRAEYIRVYPGEGTDKALERLYEKADQLPLTGVFWDQEVIVSAMEGGLQNMSSVLDTLHDETEARYSDDELREFCICNEYYFFPDGKFCRY